MAFSNSIRTKIMLAAGIIVVVVLIASLNYKKTSSAKHELSIFRVPANDWTYIAEEKGWLTKAFEKDGIKIQLVQGTSGKEALLFSRDELNIAERMLYPTLLYKSNGYDISVVDVTNHPDPKIASIIVPIDSPITNFSDLKGKKIASWRASCPYMVLFELAENQKWKIGEDFTYVNIAGSENKTVLLTKEVDALAAHPLGDVAPLIVNGLAKEIAYPDKDSLYVQGGGVVVNFTPSPFAKEHPDVVKKYIDIRYQTLAWIGEHEDEAAAIIERITRTPAAVSKFSWRRSIITYKPEHSYKQVLEDTERTQNWLVENGDIPKEKKVDLSTLFAKPYFIE